MIGEQDDIETHNNDLKVLVKDLKEDIKSFDRLIGRFVSNQDGYLVDEKEFIVSSSSEISISASSRLNQILTTIHQIKIINDTNKKTLTDRIKELIEQHNKDEARFNILSQNLDTKFEKYLNSLKKYNGVNEQAIKSLLIENNNLLSNSMSKYNKSIDQANMLYKNINIMAIIFISIICMYVISKIYKNFKGKNKTYITSNNMKKRLKVR